MTTLLTDFDKARRVSASLIAIETQDQQGTVQSIREFVKEKYEDAPPVIAWDIVAGWNPYNEAGKRGIKEALGDSKKPSMLNNPSEMLNYAKKLPKQSILFMQNAHRFIGSENTNQAAVGQGISNLRDEFKQDIRTLALLGPGFLLPEELKQDVLILSEPLPTPVELRGLVERIYTDNNLDIPANPKLDKAQEILRGLSRYAAETTTALAMDLANKGELDLELLWAKKRSAIQQVPGLGVWKGRETYTDVEGVDQGKRFLSAVCTGEDAPTVIVFADEIEKALSGTQGDLSGVSQEMHGMLLSWMADEEVEGLLMYGQPGCSKSFIAKATGGQFGLPVVLFNMSLLKGSLVGQSTLQLKAALKMISAIGKPLMLATCNELDVLSPELKSRFELGTMFFDLPTPQELKKVWELYIKKFGLIGKIPPGTENWTPREVRACCRLAKRIKWSLADAAKNIVPVIQSSPELIEKRRQLANNRFLSSSYQGIYQFDQDAYEESKKRKLMLSGVGEA